MPSWKKVITSGSSAALQSLTVTGGITGSLLGTSSWATNALTASFVTTAQTASYVLNAQSSSVANAVRISNNDTTATPQYIGFVGAQSGTSTLFTDIDLTYIPNTNTLNTTSSRAITSSFAITASFVTTAQTASYVLQAVSSSFATNASTASYVLNAISASFASTASSVNTLNQNVLITGSLTVGSSSLGASENTITLGARDTGGEGGQLGFNAPGGTYTSASMIDNYQNRLRILRGTNAGSDAEVAWWSMHTKQMALPAYNSTSAFPGTAAATLAVDSSGNVITIAGSGGGTVTQVNTSGTVNGITLTGGPITTSGTVTLGGTLSNVQSSQLATSSLMVGNSSISLGATASSLTGLTSVTATSFTGSFTGSHFGPLTGTASYATQALSASFALTSSNVQGGTANYIPIWNTATSLSSSAIYQSVGNIGIGTTSPTSPFFVTTTTPNPSTPYVTIEGYAAGAYPMLRFNQINGSGNAPFIEGYHTNGGTLTFRVKDTGDGYFSGSVGIGTNTPTHPLNVYTTVADTGILLDSNTNPAFIVKRAGVERLKLSAAGSIGTINGLGNGLVFQTDSSERMRINTSGNVGIGTTTPGYRLSVSASSNSDGIQVVKDGSSKVVLTGDGVIIWGASADYGTLTWDTGKTIVRASSGKALSLGSNATDDRLYINTSGNVGIGTTTPNAKLDVNGNVIITGSLTVTNGITGSLFGTSSWASNAVTASYITASNVFGPFGSNSIISASYAVTASYALTSSFSLATSANTVLVINKSGATISKGMVVHLTGSNNSSDTPYVITASYESDSLSANTLGIASQTITNNNTGFITTEGVLTGVDVTGYISGQVLYLGAAGSITGSAPLAPLHSVRLGQVVRDSPSNNGAIYVRIDNGYELEELHNVLDTSTTSSYGDLLVRSGSVWTNSRQLTGSYGLTGSLNVTDTVQIGTTLIDYVSVNPSISGSNTIYTQATGSYTSAFMKYSVSSGSNTRAGEFMTAWNGTNIVYTDTSTTDIGNTAGVSFISSIVSSQLRVSASCTTAGWNIKTLSTFI